MSDRFPLNDLETAPEAARAALTATQQTFGTIPNLERVLASAPPVLAAYNAVWDLFDQTTLSAIERHVVYLTANFENECDYCVPWHSMLAEQDGMDAATLEALRNGAPLPDPKLDALRSFTRTLIANRGKVAAGELDAFFAAGYRDVQAMEVILGLAVKTLSNYTNSVAGTPLDRAVHGYRWTKPKIRMRDGGQD